MSYPPLNNITTPDKYSEAATVLGQGSGRVTVDVANAASYVVGGSAADAPITSITLVS